MNMHEFIERATTTGEIFIPGGRPIYMGAPDSNYNDQEILKQVREFESNYHPDNSDFTWRNEKSMSKDDIIREHLKSIGL